MDIIDSPTRSAMMARIKGKNTRAEIIVRTGLHKLGFRYQLHRKNLPGKPDLVFPKHHAVIFVNGCFWHGHTCKYFKLPATNTEFWRDKIGANQERDELKTKQLINLGYTVLRIWECQTRAGSESFDALIDIVAANLRRDELRD